MNIIDAHANVGTDASNLRKNLLPVEQSEDYLLMKMKEHSIAKAIVIPFPSPVAEFNPDEAWYAYENHYLLDVVQAKEGRLLPFLCVNPTDTRSVEMIETLTGLHEIIKGIKLSHTVRFDFSIDALVKHPLMKIVQDRDLRFMIHIGTGKELGSARTNVSLDAGIKVAQAYPDVQFIFCHLGRLHQLMFKALELENVHMDTSGLSMQAHWKQFAALEPMEQFKKSTPAQVIERLVDAGYDSKIIWGSDEPYTHYEAELAYVNQARIPEWVKKKIFAGNIENLLEL